MRFNCTYLGPESVYCANTHRELYLTDHGDLLAFSGMPREPADRPRPGARQSIEIGSLSKVTVVDYAAAPTPGADAVVALDEQDLNQHLGDCLVLAGSLDQRIVRHLEVAWEQFARGALEEVNFTPLRSLDELAIPGEFRGQVLSASPYGETRFDLYIMNERGNTFYWKGTGSDNLNDVHVGTWVQMRVRALKDPHLQNAVRFNRARILERTQPGAGLEPSPLTLFFHLRAALFAASAEARIALLPAYAQASRIVQAAAQVVRSPDFIAVEQPAPRVEDVHGAIDNPAPRPRNRGRDRLRRYWL